MINILESLYILLDSVANVGPSIGGSIAPIGNSKIPIQSSFRPASIIPKKKKPKKLLYLGTSKISLGLK